MHVTAMAPPAYKKKCAQNTTMLLQHSRVVCVHVAVAAWMNSLDEQRLAVSSLLMLTLTQPIF